MYSPYSHVISPLRKLRKLAVTSCALALLASYAPSVTLAARQNPDIGGLFAQLNHAAQLPTYVGELQDGGAAVAIVLTGVETAVAYVCNGVDTGIWLKGSFDVFTGDL